MKIVASGMSGFIGRPLQEALKQKHELVILRRDASQEERDRQTDGADAVINLSGEPIAGGRWTKARKKELITSRLQTTRAWAKAIGKARVRPKVFINASATGYYGPRDDAPVDESAPAGMGFLADLCKEWERQAMKAESLDSRVVLLRTGIVLGRQGGALGKMLLPFKMGLGGPLGSGKQMMSWIHLDDEVSAIRHVLETPSIRGPVNLTAPNPVRMSEFAKCLGKALRRPALIPVPAFALRILLGEMSGLLLTGQNVIPGALCHSGFQFKFSRLEPALLDLA